MSSQDVKDEIDAQSGRFEFLKQALTLGIAGLAATAAIFTDTANIPSDVGVIAAVCAIGLILLGLVGASLMGLSAYANLLKAHSENAAVASFRKSMVWHAQAVFVCIVLIALAFMVYAGLQVLQRDTPRITASEAIDQSRKAIASSGCDAVFESVDRAADTFRIVFRSTSCRRRFVVAVRPNEGVVSIRPAAD